MRQFHFARWVLCFACELLACRTVAPTPPQLLAALEQSPRGFLSGLPTGLVVSHVLNAEDFVYDAKLSGDSGTAAVLRLAAHSFQLSLHATREARAPTRAEALVTPVEIDAEALEFSPDGKVIATVARDAALRVFSNDGARPLGAWLTEEPLVSVAWHPSGDLLALGSAKGLVTVVTWPTLEFRGELRPHEDEVRALAFAPDGTLYSAGWDGKVCVLELGARADASRSVRLAVDKTRGITLFRALFDGRALGSVTIDNRLPGIVIRQALAQSAGIDVARLDESVEISTGAGVQRARVARSRTVAFKSLLLEDVDLVVCDACLPPEAQGALGQSFLQRVSVSFDEVTASALLEAKPDTAVGQQTSIALMVAQTFSFPAAVNDLSLDASGNVLGLALSHAKSQRTREVYEREKRHEVEPEREWDCGARVDAHTGAVLEKVRGHRGVVATAGISPDGRTLATGGWDKTLRVHFEPEDFVDRSFGWALRRVRFSRDGRWLIAAAWTPQNPLGNHQTNPSAVMYEVRYGSAQVQPAP